MHKKNDFLGLGIDRPEQFGNSARRQEESNRSAPPVHDCCERRSQQRRKICLEQILIDQRSSPQGQSAGLHSVKPKCEGYIPFTKMQGLGNDFVVIDAVTHDISLSTESIHKISDRHFGVGCDQILVLEPPTIEQPNVDFTYRIFNADGSEAGQCGNGIRCLAKFVAEHGLAHKRDLAFATKSCKMQTHLENDGQITVTIGNPIFEPKDIPFVAEKRALRYNLPIADCGAGFGEIEIGAVSIGNPHAVVLLEGNIADYIVALGPLISNSKHFPERVNVNFMQVLNRKQIKLRVYERGSGETLACGSGACAAVVVGRLWGLLDSMVLVKLRGGDLLIKWDEHSDNIQMTGPAEQVFNGEIILAR